MENFSNDSVGFNFLLCLISPPTSFLYLSFFTTNVLLLLPLCIFILHLGLQRWRQQRSTSTPITHSDSFTYHMVAMEMVGISGRILFCCGIYSSDLITACTGYCLSCFTWFGESFFHVLTCVERYLAVVHPVTYLSLRNERGIRLRNISIGCVWLFSVVGTGLMALDSVSTFLNFSFLVISFFVISFCSLSVLCALIRPGPGEQGRVGQSKQRAFNAITVVLGVLFARCVWNLIWFMMYVLMVPDCIMLAWPIWFNLPSSLMLPLMFLHRAGKLACCSKSSKDG